MKEPKINTIRQYKLHYHCKVRGDNSTGGRRLRIGSSTFFYVREDDEFVKFIAYKIQRLVFFHNREGGECMPAKSMIY